MNISSLNPHIRFARLHKTALMMSREPSICYDCRIFYFTNISGYIAIGDEKYNILNNTAVFLPPETEYKFNINFNENPSFIVLNFDLTTRNEHIDTSIGTSTKSNFNKSLVPEYELPLALSEPLVRNLPHIKHMLVQCINSFIIKGAFYRESASAFLKLCLIEFLRDESNITHSKTCKDVLSYIHQNYTNPELTNQDIAAQFSYHPYHLSNIVKEETGKTLHQFLIYYRLRMARDLLITTDYDISEIAWKCGFASAAYFTKLFGRNTKMTPKEYRRLYANTLL